MSVKKVFTYRNFVIREHEDFYTIDLTDMVFDTLEEVKDFIDCYYM